MNRRNFLKVVASAAAIAAAPTLAIPNDASLVGIPNKSQKVIGEITRDITYHPERQAYFVNYSGEINGAQYYCGDYVSEDELTVQFLSELEKNVMIRFRKRL